MLKRIVLAMLSCAAFAACTGLLNPTRVEAYGEGQPTDWNRFYYYPYVYYPQNFQNNRGSYNHLYYRYPAQRRIPVYNKGWHNFYPKERPYHRGHHFILDVF